MPEGYHLPLSVYSIHLSLLQGPHIATAVPEGDQLPQADGHLPGERAQAQVPPGKNHFQGFILENVPFHLIFVESKPSLKIFLKRCDVYAPFCFSGLFTSNLLFCPFLRP